MKIDSNLQHKPDTTLRVVALLTWFAVSPLAIWFYATNLGVDGGLILVGVAGIAIGGLFWFLGGIIRS